MDHTNTQRAQALHRQLSRNEAACVRDNIIVRVDTISDDRRVAMCSVEQCLYGLLRRPLSYHELVGRAERALAPLSAIGLIALISVRPKAADGNLHGAEGPVGWPAALWQWLGHPLARNGYGHVLLFRDPFGWRKAMEAGNNGAFEGTSARVA